MRIQSNVGILTKHNKWLQVKMLFHSDQKALSLLVLQQ